jgi:hypothetical protein
MEAAGAFVTVFEERVYSFPLVEAEMSVYIVFLYWKPDELLALQAT